MMIKSIEGYGDLNHDSEKGTVHSADDMVYLLIKHGIGIDYNNYEWHFHSNICEGYFIDCVELGIQHDFKSFDEFVIGIRLFIEGELK